MKKIFVFLLGMVALCTQAQESAKEQQKELVPLEVIAPISESFMGRIFHFSYWEVLEVNSYLPNPVLTLQPSWKYNPNKNGVPNMVVQYAIKRGITPNTLLEAEDELLSFTTETTEPTRNSHTKFIPCAEGVVSYSVFEGQNLITTVVTKQTTQGYIIFSGILKQNPKTSVEVNTKQIKTDFGTFTNQHTTVKFDKKDIEKEAVKYAHAMCQKPFPKWLKNVPTVEEIHSQTREPSQKPATSVAPQRHAVPNKKVTTSTKTVVPKLQRVQPTYRSSK